MNIKLVSQKTGLSSSQIRYYEKQNIIPAVTRDSFGNRDFAQILRIPLLSRTRYN